MTKNSKSIHGLPAQSYTDQQFWEIECNTVLSDGWLFVGFVHEFLKAGDVIPISIAGWGVREGVMVVLLGLIGISSESALALSILYGIILTIVGLMGGIFWLFERK